MLTRRRAKGSCSCATDPCVHARGNLARGVKTTHDDRNDCDRSALNV
jgi:hypothetical protein